MIQTNSQPYWQRVKTAVFCTLLLALGACSNAYYNAMEQVGIHKRDILVDRVEAARDSQQEAQQQFNSALEELTQLTNFDGGELEQAYDQAKTAYESSQASADDVSHRIDKISSVADALFVEWEEELSQYSNAKLRADSRKKLSDTQAHYQRLLKTMRKAEGKMQPVLSALKDNMLYLKHNLNAQAVSSLSGEFDKLKTDVQRLIREMDVAIKESDAFIATLKK